MRRKKGISPITVLILIFLIGVLVGAWVFNGNKELQRCLKFINKQEQELKEKNKEIERLKKEAEIARRVKYIMRRYGCKDQTIFEEIMRAKKSGMDPVKVAIVIAKESEFNPDAESPCGAVGLMQISPVHGIYATKDIVTNIRFGIKYLKEQRDSFGSDELMLAGYNAGPGAVKKYGGVPPYKETLKYISFYKGMLEKVNQLPSEC